MLVRGQPSLWPRHCLINNAPLNHYLGTSVRVEKLKVTKREEKKSKERGEREREMVKERRGEWEADRMGEEGVGEGTRGEEPS